MFQHPVTKLHKNLSNDKSCRVQFLNNIWCCFKRTPKCHFGYNKPTTLNESYRLIK